MFYLMCVRACVCARVHAFVYVYACVCRHNTTVFQLQCICSMLIVLIDALRPSQQL